MDRTNEENAHDFCEAIKLLAARPDKLDNLENYLTTHFYEWLSKYASTPDGITNELKQFAEMKWE